MNKTSFEKLGMELRRYRKKTGFGLKRIAPLLGVDYTYLSKFENGLERPSIDFLNKLVDFYALSKGEAENLFCLAGYRGGVVTMKDERGGNGKVKGNIKSEVVQEKKRRVQVKLDPARTPVFYADSVHIKADDNGFVLDFAQQIGPTKEFNIVARVGLSKGHIGRLAAKLLDLIKKREGKSETGKVKLVN